jgi:EAL domain-containing protein (putative c-di-GMP-specific phosphodiesterase class I)
VEDAADWDFLRGTACDYAQGFFIGRPMAGSEIAPWADAWRERVRGFGST